MGAILRLVGGAAGPWILGAVVAAFLGLAAAGGAQWARATKLEAALATAQADNVGLQASLDRQNAEVDRIGRECAAKAADAALAAVRALQRPAPKVDGSGPASLNSWLKERFR